MSTTSLSLSMLAVFVIAAVVMFAAFLFLNSRPQATGEPEVEARRRRLLLGAIVCALVGIGLAVVPVGYVFLSLLTPAS